MKIISCNVNGIRSAYKKGLLNFINKEKPDILCLQEIKAKNEREIAEKLAKKESEIALWPAETISVTPHRRAPTSSI